MKKTPMQIANISVYDKDNKLWFEPYEIKNLLITMLNTYPTDFEVELHK